MSDKHFTDMQAVEAGAVCRAAWIEHTVSGFDDASAMLAPASTEIAMGALGGALKAAPIGALRHGTSANRIERRSWRCHA